MTSKQPGMLPRVLVSLVLVVAFVFGGRMVLMKLWAMKTPPVKGAERPPLVRVSVEKLQRRDYQESLVGYGRARAIREVIVSAQVQGVVAEIAEVLEAGRTVAEGDLLVRIDDFDYLRAQENLAARSKQLEDDILWKTRSAESAEAQLEVARRELELYRAELVRTVELQKSGTASESALDDQRRATSVAERLVVKLENDSALARIDIDKARATLAATEAQAAQAARDLARCEIRAPFAGIVLGRVVELGGRVAPGAELCRIVDPNRIEVAIALPASFKDAVQPGSAVAFESADGSNAFAAAIARVSPAIDADERTFLAYVELTASGERPLPAPGAFLRAVVTGAMRRDVYVIPRTAYLGDRVFVIKRLESKPSEALVESQVFSRDRVLPDVVLSRDPRAEGMEIVRDNLEQVASGTRVAVVESGAREEELSK